MQKLLIYLFFTAIAMGCSGQQEDSSRRSSQEVQEQRIKARREFLKKERTSIKAYIKDRDLEMKRTGTGMHYQILNDSSAEATVEPKDVVTYEYRIYMMNGNLLYSSKQVGAASLKIDRQDAEQGLHEALKLLGLGDRGRFILPSHLAFGVAGDQQKVPPMTALVYELKVVDIEKSKS